MKDPEQHPEPKVTEISADNLSKKRRAFIKGSAAVLPIVLTLRNGSAFAAVSISCVDKQASIVPKTITDTLNADTFVRDPTKVRVITPVGGGNPITIYEYPLGSGQWYRETDNSTGAFFKEYKDPHSDNMLMTYSNISTAGVNYTFSSSNDKDGWILAQLDRDTRLRVLPPVVGPKDNYQNSTIVATQSCASSLRP